MCDDTLRASFFAEAIPNFRLPRKYLPSRSPYQKPHFPCFCLPFQVETFTPCLQRCLLAGDPPSCYSASSIQAGNPHPSPILLLLPHPTCHDRWHERDTFHPNHRPLHQISAALSHGARSIARISRSIWQRRSKSRPHARMRSRWLPFVPTHKSWRSTSPSSHRLRLAHRRRDAVGCFKRQFMAFSRGHRRCLRRRLRGVFSACTCLPHLESQQVGARSGSGNSPLQQGHPRCGGLALFHVQGANRHRYL